MALPSEKKSIAVFGSTGSIGTSTLNVIAYHADKFEVKILTAQKNYRLLAEQAKIFKPKIICISDQNFYKNLKDECSGLDIKILSGEEGLVEAASQKIDLHIAAIMGFAGLKPLYTALDFADAIALVNKEPLVAAGQLILNKAQKNNVKLLPTDSEHNAIFQIFENENRKAIQKIYLTASGGAFRDLTLEQIEDKRLEDALKHPNWSMGQKITIDSATMMNKALEMIEAKNLFALPSEKIEVLLHPQSLIHGLVEYADGSTLAQMGAADMRTALTYVLGYPNRLQTSGACLDFKSLLNFELKPIDETRYRAINLAKQVMQAEQQAAILFNAANEIFVEAFSFAHIPFGRIVPYIEEMLQNIDSERAANLEEIVNYNNLCRIKAQEFLERKKR